jgi:hypothetical protein
MKTRRGKNRKLIPQRLSRQTLFSDLFIHHESSTIFQEPTIALFTFCPPRRVRIPTALGYGHSEILRYFDCYANASGLNQYLIAGRDHSKNRALTAIDPFR